MYRTVVSRMCVKRMVFARCLGLKCCLIRCAWIPIWAIHAPVCYSFGQVARCKPCSSQEFWKDQHSMFIMEIPNYFRTHQNFLTNDLGSSVSVRYVHRSVIKFWTLCRTREPTSPDSQATRPHPRIALWQCTLLSLIIQHREWKCL